MVALEWSTRQMQALIRNDETVEFSGNMTNIHPILGAKPCFVTVTDLRLLYIQAGYSASGTRSLPHAFITTPTIKNKLTSSVVGMIAGGEWYVFAGPKYLMKRLHSLLTVRQHAPRTDFGTTTRIRANGY